MREEREGQRGRKQRKNNGGAGEGGRGCDNFTATTFHSAEASCSLQEGAAPPRYRHRPSSAAAQPSFQCAISPVLSLAASPVLSLTQTPTRKHARTRAFPWRKTFFLPGFCDQGKCHVRIGDCYYQLLLLLLIESRTHPASLPANITYVQNCKNIRKKFYRLPPPLHTRRRRRRSAPHRTPRPLRCSQGQAIQAGSFFPSRSR